MSHHLPALLVIAPLLSAFLVSAAGWINRRLCFPIGVVGLGLSVFSALFILLRVMNEGPVEYHLGGWAPPWGIAYLIDSLNALVALVVAVVSFVNFIATVQDVREEFGVKIGQFYTLYLLMTTGLLGMVVTGDAFNLYVLLEIASLTGYGLIAMGDKRAPLAALNYVYMGTIGASFYLLGVGYLYIVTGSLNMADIANLLPDMYSTKPVLVAFIFCIGGRLGQDGVFPAARLAAQRLRPCSQRGQLPHRPAHDQGHGVCHDPAYFLRLHSRVCLLIPGSQSPPSTSRKPWCGSPPSPSWRASFWP